MKISDTFDFPEAEVTEGFMLSLRDHQLRTMSWMKSIESLELNDSTTIVNNILEDDPECRLKLKVGDTPYYLGIPNPSSDIYSPKITELEPLRIFGGILADDTGSGKTVTTIPARRLKKEKKNMKNDSYLMACMCHHVLLFNYITDLIERDTNARIILFVQYNDLACYMMESFKELAIRCFRVHGTVITRQRSITQFKESKDVRVILMSAAESVSGINLTEATHVILLHPFWTGRDESVDLAYEKQGIARAYRLGLTHPLKVVRFAVRGTIEEDITKRRENINMNPRI